MIHTILHDTGSTAVRPRTDRLTAANAKPFRDGVGQLIEGGASRLVLDLSQVTFVDSSGLGALVGILKRIGHRGDLVVAGLGPDVARMFRLCRMDSVFRNSSSVDEAVQVMAATR